MAARHLGARKTRWFLGLALVLSATAAVGQKPQVERFTFDDGLPSSAIFDLDQDASGRLWIVGRGGITIYDGRTFQTFSAEDGLPEATLRSIEIDGSGRVWTVTRSPPEVFYLDDTVWQSSPKPPEDFGEKEIVTSMIVTGEGASATVWLGTMESGIWVLEDGWSQIGVERGLSSYRVNGLANHQGGLVAATDAGLCRIDGQKPDCQIQGADPHLSDPILGVSSIPGDSRLWLLGGTWLGHLEGDALTVLAEGLDMASLNPSLPGGITTDSVGGVYFGSSGSGFYLDPEDEQFQPLGQIHGLASEGMSKLLTDREHNVWIGGLRGLSRVASRRFESYDRDAGLLESEVSAIAEMADGTLVTGHNSGLSFFDGERFQTVDFQQPEAPAYSHRVFDMAIDDRGNVWVAAHRMGLLRVAPDFSWRVMIADTRALSVEWHDQAGLWVATRAALLQRQGDRFVTIDAGLDPESESFRWVDISDDGRLYVAGRGGVRWQEQGRWQVANGPTRAADNVFTVLATDDTVWAGTGAGLYRLEGNELVKVRLGEFAINKPVFMMLQDAEGRMWFGTDGGVVLWDGREARTLTAEQGLIGRETNRGGGWVDRQGRVWIGTDKGMSMFRPRYDRQTVVKPQVQVLSVDVDSESWSAQQPLSLTHDQNDLTFRFRAVSLSHGRELQYRHRLEGFDDDWLGPFPLSTGEVRYTSLPPGEYRFSVTSGWNESSWSPETRSAPIVVARPFWRQIWFYGLVALALGLGVPGLVLLRTRRIQARNARLENLNRQLSSHIDERESLISELEGKNEELERFAYTVSHDLKSPLVTIQGFLGYLKKHAETADVDRMHADIGRIENAAGTMAKLLDDLLELSRLGHVAHQPEALPLGSVAQEAAELVTQQISERGVEVDIAANLPTAWVDQQQFLELFQNLIENAVKFMGDQRSPRIEIGLRAEEAQPVIYVRDNGVGIEPRFHDQIFGLFNRLDQSIQGTGVGLALVRRIVEVHGGRIWVESEGTGHGTTFCFTVPLADSTEAA